MTGEGDVMRTSKLGWAAAVSMVAFLDAGTALAQTVPQARPAPAPAGVTLPLAQPTQPTTSAPVAAPNVQIEGQQAAPRSYLTAPAPASPMSTAQPSTVVVGDDEAQPVQDNGQGDGQWVYLNDTGWTWVPSSATPVAVNDQPYVYLYTPSVGWGWSVSPWGWGPYYYGPWAGAYGPGFWGGYYHPGGWAGWRGAWGGYRGAWGGGGYHGGYGGYHGGGGYGHGGYGGYHGGYAGHGMGGRSYGGGGRHIATPHVGGHYGGGGSVHPHYQYGGGGGGGHFGGGGGGHFGGGGHGGGGHR
jgi:hypothetical protein